MGSPLRHLQPLPAETGALLVTPIQVSGFLWARVWGAGVGGQTCMGGPARGLLVWHSPAVPPHCGWSLCAPLLLGDVAKFGRGDSASPAPPTTLAQPQQSPSQAHHTAQQPFLSPALPPGYSYTPGLPYYSGVPSAFQYGPTVFVSIGGCWKLLGDARRAG